MTSLGQRALRAIRSGHPISNTAQQITTPVVRSAPEALRLATRLGVMNVEKVLQSDSPGEVMNQPVIEFVASLVGVENLLHGEVSKNKEGLFVASVSGQEIEAPGLMDKGVPVILCIRPENVILSEPAQGPQGRPENTFPATVERITVMGPYHKIQLNCGFPLVAYVTNPSFSELSLKEGTEVLAFFNSKSVHAICDA